MTRRMAIWVSVLGMVIAPITGISQVAEVGKQETEDRTLSPYFAIKNGDPSVDNFPLKRTEVKVSIVGVIAHVTVTQTYENRGERPINAKYIFPASTRAAVHGMKMTIGEHVITARIRERQTAKKEFKAAKKAGKSAALLEQQRPNVFSMNVANVMPGDVIDVELRYSELIVPVDGTYDFVYPTVVGPRYSEITGGTATDHDTWVESPYLHDGEDTPSVFDRNLHAARIRQMWYGRARTRHWSLLPTRAGPRATATSSCATASRASRYNRA
jgi:Ca-activated chloride channel family protein